MDHDGLRCHAQSLAVADDGRAGDVPGAAQSILQMRHGHGVHQVALA
jgi:hypothetical protein